jgi:hypothetical protein
VPYTSTIYPTTNHTNLHTTHTSVATKNLRNQPSQQTPSTTNHTNLHTTHTSVATKNLRNQPSQQTPSKINARPPQQSTRQPTIATTFYATLMSSDKSSFHMDRLIFQVVNRPLCHLCNPLYNTMQPSQQSSQ